MTTLPQLAARWGVSLDALRALVRRSPELKALGTVFGPQRVFSPEDAARIREAFAARPPAGRRAGRRAGGAVAVEV